MIEILFILMVNGEPKTPTIKFHEIKTTEECWAFGNSYRDKHTVYDGDKHLHVFKKNKGVTFWGFICK